MEHNNLPLLLLDNNSEISVMNEGTFKCHNLTLEEAKVILEEYSEDDIVRCFNDQGIETIIFEYLGIAKKNFTYKNIRKLEPLQNAIVFKLYITPSETQPIIRADDGIEAKKIQNIYVYCQCITRIL